MNQASKGFPPSSSSSNNNKWTGNSKPKKANYQNEQNSYALKPTPIVPPNFQPSSVELTGLRKICGDHISTIIKIEGIVLRISQPKLSLKRARFACPSCGNSMNIMIERQDRVFTPPRKCTAEKCNGKFELDISGSELEKIQTVKLQELPNSVPSGTIPVVQTVLFFDKFVNLCIPGDTLQVCGIVHPLPETIANEIPEIGQVTDRNYANVPVEKPRINTGTFDVLIEAIDVEKKTKKFSNMISDDGTSNKLEAIASKFSNNFNLLFNILARSIAPEISGLLDVKKAILLQMVGGTSKNLRNSNKGTEGMKIRGDINMLLCGDPGLAKSQLLKYVSHVSPKAVYTTGKGSSGVGLTAAVIKDTTTNEMTLEGGSLVLADQGICCIDEFDKMEEHDRTALHEVMEQQTISVAKAGITTTLNARVSILAAANPIYGSYNPNFSVSYNVNLPNALLSRFDLLFLLLDVKDEELDKRMSSHIFANHLSLKESTIPWIQRPQPFDLSLKKQDNDENIEFEKFDEELDEELSRNLSNSTIGGSEVFRYFDVLTLGQFIAQAKTFNPAIPKDSVIPRHIVDTYCEMRQKDTRNTTKDAYITPRTLLAVIRLATARAKLRFDNFVNMDDVDEAFRLMESAVSSVTEKRTVQMTIEQQKTKVFQILKDYSTKKVNKSFLYSEISQKMYQEGINLRIVKETLEKYSNLNVLKFTAQNDNPHAIEFY